MVGWNAGCLAPSLTFFAIPMITRNVLSEVSRPSLLQRCISTIAPMELRNRW
jgi:hypothetical protein